MLMVTAVLFTTTALTGCVDQFPSPIGIDCDSTEQEYLGYAAGVIVDYNQTLGDLSDKTAEWTDGNMSDSQFRNILANTVETLNDLGKSVDERDPYPGYENAHRSLVVSIKETESAIGFFRDYVDSEDYSDGQAAYDHLNTAIKRLGQAEVSVLSGTSSCLGSG